MTTHNLLHLINENFDYDKNSIVFKAGDEFMYASKCQQFCKDNKNNLKLTIRIMIK